MHHVSSLYRLLTSGLMIAMASALIITMVVTAAPTPSMAATIAPEDVLADPTHEARAQALSERLRCVVCANQSIADSEATLALDMQRLVRRRIAAGDSDQQILDDLIARYGDRILLNPPITTRTYLLWGLPVVFVLLVLAVLWARRQPVAGQAPLTPLAIDGWDSQAQHPDAAQAQDQGRDT
ncbi:MAG: cytochrome c-type biogenesis protein [Pseudomonadota bacterium]